MGRMEDASVGEVYARSLLELALARADAETIDREFSEFAAYLKIDPDFRAFVTSRVIDSEVRQVSLDRMFKGRMNDLLLDTLQVLNRKDRLELVTHVERNYHELFLKHQGIVEVHVTTAEPLEERLRAALHQAMTTRTGKQVTLIEHVDPAVLGGLIVRVGDEQIDVSVARQLRRFYQLMLDHASRHIHEGTELFEDAAAY